MGESHSMPKVSDEGSFDELASLYDGEVGEVYNFVLRRCGANVALSEDITQETFLAAARHYRVTADVPAPGWLYQVARRRLVDHWRAEARKDRKVRLVSGGRPGSEAADPADEVVSGRRVAMALAELPASQQAAFALRYLDGYSTKEVAEAIGRSVKATESVLARARQKLASTYVEHDRD